MKIYCAARHESPLDKFVGKEVWIRVRIVNDNMESWGTSYIRLLQKLEYSSGTFYVINRIYPSTHAYYRDPLDYVLNSNLEVRADRIKLATPIDILTTEELVDQYNLGEEK